MARETRLAGAGSPEMSGKGRGSPEMADPDRISPDPAGSRRGEAEEGEADAAMARGGAHG